MKRFILNKKWVKMILLGIVAWLAPRFVDLGVLGAASEITGFIVIVIGVMRLIKDRHKEII